MGPDINPLTADKHTIMAVHTFLRTFRYLTAIHILRVNINATHFRQVSIELNSSHRDID